MTDDGKGKPPTTAKELIDFAAPKAAEMFEKDGGLQPLWHVVCADGQHGIIAAPMRSGREKDIVAAAMRETMVRLDAVACMFMCESWLLWNEGSDKKLDVDLESARRGGISQHPDRKECLWFSAEDAEGNVTACQIIDRPDGPGGRGVLRPLRVLGKTSRMEGRFIGMLPVKGRAN